jgi:hypothetical protein
MGFIKKLLFVPLFLLFISVFFAPKANAALINVSDDISTSRPSASTTIIGNDQTTAGTVGQVNVFDNGSMFLASDSAILRADTGQTQDVLTVASMSAQQAGQSRYVYFTGLVPHIHHAGTNIINSITATHTITLVPGITIPINGKIVITFPTITDLVSGSNTASPSATGFSFNGESATPTDITCWDTSQTSNNCINGGGNFATNQANTVTITLGSAAIAAGHTVIINIGCSGTNTAGVCTGQAPRLINPTSSYQANCSNGGTGGSSICQADIWKLQVQTQGATSNALETSRIAIGTINSVQVTASVEPTFTFKITGFSQGTSWADNTSGSTTCGVDFINTGFDTTATSVNLGTLNNGNFSKAAQLIDISTNGSYGYSLTATSSGHLINASSGNWLPDVNSIPGGINGLTANDTPVPYGILKNGTNASGSAYFGISPCGSDVSAMWGGAGKSSINSNFSNPWNTIGNDFAATLASYTGGYVNDDQTHGKTVVRYAASIAPNTPAGVYTTVLTYVATASF